MQLREVTAVPEEALPLAVLKEHLRLGTGFSDAGAEDAVLRGWLRAALAAIERRIDKVLIAREFSLVLSRWSDADSQVLPLAPVSEIAEVRLFDGTGQSARLDSLRWGLMRDDHRPRLEGRHLSLPALPEGGWAEIRLTAGFGAFSAVPADLQQAVLMLAAQYHEHRHDGGSAVGAMPFGVAALLEPWRVVRSFGGRR